MKQLMLSEYFWIGKAAIELVEVCGLNCRYDWCAIISTAQVNLLVFLIDLSKHTKPNAS